MDLKERLNDEIEILKQGRDELQVQLHLGAAEAREAWDKVEKNWNHLEARVKQIGHAGQDSIEEIEEAAQLLVSEIKAGYQNVRDLL